MTLNEAVVLLLFAVLILAVMVEIMVRIFFRWGADVHGMGRRRWWRRYFGF